MEVPRSKNFRVLGQFYFQIASFSLSTTWISNRTPIKRALEQLSRLPVSGFLNIYRTIKVPNVFGYFHFTCLLSAHKNLSIHGVCKSGFLCKSVCQSIFLSNYWYQLCFNWTPLSHLFVRIVIEIQLFYRYQLLYS